MFITSGKFYNEIGCRGVKSCVVSECGGRVKQNKGRSFSLDSLQVFILCFTFYALVLVRICLKCISLLVLFTLTFIEGNIQGGEQC